MADIFDPYYKWLGIPPEEQPPDHYRLLGIRRFEDDFEVIEEASYRVMAHLKTHQMGRHSAESQRLLNEVAAVKVCLLSADKKRAYDERLQADSSPSVPPPVAPVPSVRPIPNEAKPPARELQGPIVTPGVSIHPTRRRQKSSSAWLWLVGIGAMGAIVVLGTLLAKQLKSPEVSVSEEIPEETQAPQSSEPSLPSESTDSPQGKVETSQDDEPSTDPTSEEPQPLDPEAVYLWDLKEHGLWSWEQQSIRQYETILFDGKGYQKSLVLKPRSGRNGRVSFALSKGYIRFRGAVGLIDSESKLARAISFRIEGDGEILWESPSIKERKISHAFDLDVEEVTTLTLHVINPKSVHYCRPIFIEPFLISKETSVLEEPLVDHKGPDPPQPTSPSSPEKHPVPEKDALLAAKQAIEERFQDEYEDRRLPSRMALARTLFNKSAQTKTPSAEHYVMLDEACRLASESGEGDAAFQAIDRIDQTYQIEALSQKADVVDAMGEFAQTPVQISMFVEQAVQLWDQAMEQADFKTADRVLRVALSKAKSQRLTPFVRPLLERQEKTEEYASAERTAREAREVLEKDADNPQAHAALGCYLCMIQHDWETGLEHLAKSDREELKQLAEMELIDTALTVEQQLELAEAYCAAAEKGKPLDREALRLRGIIAFEKAIADTRLKGLQRVRAEKMLADLKVQSLPRPLTPMPTIKVLQVAATSTVGNMNVGLHPLADTGIDIAEGQQVLLRVSGKWEYKKERRSGSYTYSTTATGGSDTLGIALGQASRPALQVVPGSEIVQFQAKHDGRLFLGILDEEPRGNRGHLDVELLVQ